MPMQSPDPTCQSKNRPPLPTHGTRFARFTPASYDATAHTVEVILSSGAQVDRGFFIEELDISPDAIDLSRVATGQCKVIDSHNAYSTGALLGSVKSTRFTGGQLIGVLEFDQGPAGQAAEGLVARGTLTGISVGYAVKAWVITEKAERSVWRATSWELLEVSFVTVPADPNAGVRSAVTGPSTTARSANGKESKMHEPVVIGAEAPPPTPAAPETRFSAEAAIDFIDAARSFSVENEARRLVRENVPPDIARQAVLKAAAERQRANTALAPGGAVVSVTRDEGDTIRSGIEDALVSRLSRKAPGEIGRQFRSMSTIDMIRFQMRQRGERNVDFLSPMEVVKRMHTTSDFPTLLSGAGNRVLMAAFAAAPNPLKDLARKATIDDFRAKYSIKLGPLPTLPLVPEGGEVKQLSNSESYESYKLGTYAGKFTLSRQAIINDDLDAFGDWAKLMATAASETEATLLVALLTANSGAGPTLTDGNALFSTAHGNLAGSGAAISTDTLSAARLAMRTQKSVGGKTLAPAVPKTLLVSATKETEAQKVLATIAPPTTADANPFAGQLALAVEPRLSGNPWYVFGDPALSPVLEYAYLSNAEGPQLDERPGWDVLGEEYRVVLDFGCGAIDYHGAYRNPGA